MVKQTKNGHNPSETLSVVTSVIFYFDRINACSRTVIPLQLTVVTCRHSQLHAV